MKIKFYWLYLILVIFHSKFAFCTTETELQINQQIPVHPEEVFYKIETLIEAPEISLPQQARYMVIQSEIAYFIAQPEHILKYSKLALSTGLLNNAWHTRALISQSRGYFQRGQYKEFFATANMAVIKAEHENLSTYLVAALIERAYSYSLLGEEAKAEKDLARAIKYLKLLPNIFDKATMLERFSATNKKLGKIEIAIAHQRQAIEIYDKVNSTHFLSISYYNLARIYQEIENWEEASNLMLKSYRWALSNKNKLNQASSLSRLSEYQDKLGNNKLAKKYLKEAVDAADESNSERVKIHVRKKMAGFLLQNNELKESEALLIKAITLAQSYQMQHDQIELMQMLAETYYQIGDYEKSYLVLKKSTEK